MFEYTDVEILELKQKEKESIKPEELFFEDKKQILNKLNK